MKARLLKFSSSVLLLSALGYGGGDILPVESYVDTEESIGIEQKEEVKTPIVEVVEKTPLAEPAQKSQGFYVGIAAAQASFDGAVAAGRLENGKPIGMIGKVGYNLYENFGVEARVGIGVKKDTINGVDNKWKSVGGVYVKPQLPLGSSVNLFGLLGYGIAKQEIGNSSLTSKGLSYGLGASYNLMENWSVGIDAVRYATEDKADSNAYAVGVDYKF